MAASIHNRAEVTIIATVLIFTLIYFPGVLAGEFAGGNGTESDPYQISNWYHLDNIRNHLQADNSPSNAELRGARENILGGLAVAGLPKETTAGEASSLPHFVLINDLDKNTEGYEELASQNANGGVGWIPIGRIEEDGLHYFSGVLDGKGYSIKDLHINQRGDDLFHIGIFSVIIGSEIKDLSLHLEEVNAEWTAERSPEIAVGGLAGVALSSQVEDVNVSGNLLSASIPLGGLMGVASTSKIENVAVSGSVESDVAVGGIVGGNSGEIISSYSETRIIGVVDAGVVAGSNDGTIKNSYSAGRVFAAERNAGGLVGVNSGQISKTYSIAEVSGSETAGNLGGLVGNNNGQVSGSFWDVELSGIEKSSGGTGKTTSEMKDVSTFTDTSTEGLSEPWDFYYNPNDDTGSENLWRMADFPQLTFENPVEGSPKTEYVQVENPGWSMVTAPLHPRNKAPTDVFNGVSPGTIFHYDPGKGKYISPSGDYKEVEALHGTWISLDKSSTPKVFTIPGIYSGNVTITLESPGWHQVGPPLDYGWADIGVKQGEDSETMTVAQQAAGPDAPHYMSRFLWEYDPEAPGAYNAYDARETSFNLKKGKAYWIKTYEPDVKLVIPYKAPPGVPSATSTEANGIPMGTEKAEELNIPNPPAPPVSLNIGEFSVQATPNPVSGEGKVNFVVAGRDIESFNVKVYTPAGKKLHSSGSQSSNSYTWKPNSRLPNGLYLYQATARKGDGETLTETGKLLVLK